MTFGSLVNANGVRCALSNIAHGGMVKKYASPIDVYDAIEDADNSKEVLYNLRKLNFVGWYNLTIDRETEKYVRIKGSDILGNIHYIKILK